MKALLKLTVPLIIIFLLVVPIVSSASPIDVLPSKQSDIFKFAAKRGMRGAELRVVYNDSGDLVLAEQVRKRRMIIDFCDVKPGAYTIVVEKGKRIETFQYVKK